MQSFFDLKIYNKLHLSKLFVHDDVNDNEDNTTLELLKRYARKDISSSTTIYLSYKYLTVCKKEKNIWTYY